MQLVLVIGAITLEFAYVPQGILVYDGAFARHVITVQKMFVVI